MTAAPLDKRGQFIAARKGDVYRALIDDLGLPDGVGEPPERFCKLLTAMLHYEYHDELERLHDAYHTLDPGRRHVTASPATDAAYTTLSKALEQVLDAANFVEVEPDELERASKEVGRIRYPVRNGAADFRAIRLFRRGQHHEEIERVTLWGLRKQKVTIEIYDEVVLFAALRTDIPAGGKRSRRRKRSVRPGSVMIKCFHNIASADLEALYPDVRIVMTTRDKMMMGVPALIAGIPLLLKLAPAAFVLYGVLRFYFGLGPEAGGGIGEALVVASAALALGGFLMNQWMKYERRALLYQKEVNDTIYFHNVTNNVGIFDYIIGVAEEQECKEAMLAYFFLLTAREPLTEHALDRKIEAWLKQRFSLEIDFEVHDALDKLERFELLQRSGGKLAVLPLPAALDRLDKRWDDIFAFTPVTPREHAVV